MLILLEHSGYHIGKKPDSRSIEIGRINNIDISDQRARQFSSTDFSKFDLIYELKIMTIILK